MLIDDGISSRGDRKNLLRSDIKTVGIATGPHKVFGTVCVIVVSIFDGMDPITASSSASPATNTNTTSNNAGGSGSGNAS